MIYEQRSDLEVVNFLYGLIDHLFFLYSYLVIVQYSHPDRKKIERKCDPRLKMQILIYTPCSRPWFRAIFSRCYLSLRSGKGPISLKTIPKCRVLVHFHAKDRSFSISNSKKVQLYIYPLQTMVFLIRFICQEDHGSNREGQGGLPPEKGHRRGRGPGSSKGHGFSEYK